MAIMTLLGSFFPGFALADCDGPISHLRQSEVHSDSPTDCLNRLPSKPVSGNEWIHRHSTLSAPDPTMSDKRLYGIGFGIKDIVVTQDFPTTMGNAYFDDFHPKVNAKVVQQLLDEGAVLVGKTNLFELAAGIGSRNDDYGHVPNAHHKAYMAGGSSGGSGVAVATHQVSFALGTDTGGSVRLPAAFNGVYGLRPSQGRYSLEGVLPLIEGSDTVGIFANFVDDVALIDELLSGDDQALDMIEPEHLRLGLLVSGFVGLDESVDKSVQSYLDVLTRQGIKLIPIELPYVDHGLVSMRRTIEQDGLKPIMRFFSSYGVELNLDRLFAAMKQEQTQGLYKMLKNPWMTRAQFDAASKQARTLIEAYDLAFHEHELHGFIQPTCKYLPQKMDDLSNQTGKYLENTLLLVTLEGPALSMPIGVGQEGIPVGIELSAPKGQDRALLSAARALETIQYH